jgi:hypothetical protein
MHERAISMRSQSSQTAFARDRDLAKPWPLKRISRQRTSFLASWASAVYSHILQVSCATRFAPLPLNQTAHAPARQGVPMRHPGVERCMGSLKRISRQRTSCLASWASSCVFTHSSGQLRYASLRSAEPDSAPSSPGRCLGSHRGASSHFCLRHPSFN